MSLHSSLCECDVCMGLEDAPEPEEQDHEPEPVTSDPREDDTLANAYFGDLLAAQEQRYN